MQQKEEIPCTNKGMQRHYNRYREFIGSREDYKKCFKMPGELVERLEAQYTQYKDLLEARIKKERVEKSREEARISREIEIKVRTYILKKIVRFIGGGIITAILLGLFLRSLDTLFLSSWFMGEP